MRACASEKEELKGGGKSKRARLVGLFCGDVGLICRDIGLFMTCGEEQLYVVYVRQEGMEVGEESKRVCVTGVEEGKVGGRAREWE